MTPHVDKTPVPVDLLRTGLYVTELDRPWIETPFLFQGFRLDNDDEIEQLRSLCRFVYIDVDRSDAEAVDAMWRDSAQRGGDRGAPEPAPEPEARSRERRDVASIRWGIEPYPDPEGFRALLRDAGAARDEARAAIEAALERAQAGKPIDVRASRAAADRLQEIVTGDATAALWLTSLKSRHEYTAVHSVNVAVLSLALGHHLGRTGERLRHIGLGALLHDIGKLRVPRRILDKPGSLTGPELELVRRHPDDGYEMVARSGDVPRQVLEVIRHHHERIDGNGYPAGLAGDRIPRHVLVAAVCDSYDAMTSQRSHAAAIPPDQALQALYRTAPESFGVDLVQELIRCLGIYPVGSTVELDNGAIGLVVGAPPGGGLWPAVLLVRTPDGEPFDKRLLVDLGAARGTGDRVAERRVSRALDPERAGVDVPAVVAGELGAAAR